MHRACAVSSLRMHGKDGKDGYVHGVIVYLVSSFGTSAASSSYWLQMRVYPFGGDEVQCQMAV